MNKVAWIKVSSILVCSLLSSCASLNGAKPEEAKVKNVIMIIGDGMGPQQIGLLLSYARQAPHSVLADRKTALERMMETGVMGLSLTYTADTLVTDSAASATQLATGFFAGAEMLGLDKDGNRRENSVELAKRLGKASGLVSDTRITHATPAAFAAHETHRSHETSIPEDLLAADPDVMLSGGLSYWLPEEVNDPNSLLRRQLTEVIDDSFEIKSLRQDHKNLLDAAKQKGYNLVFNQTQLRQAKGKTLGLFAGSAMSDGITESKQRREARHSQPTLKEMSMQALTILEGNERGFFLMIEAGQIDWASHHNDTGLLLHEMLRFNEMLNAVLDWAAKREDTLIIVTADHETGGFGFSYSAENIPEPRRLQGTGFSGSEMFKPNFNFGNPDVLDKLYAQKRSYHDIFRLFDRLPKDQQTPFMLTQLVNRDTEFKITEEQAVKILATEENPYFRAGHISLGKRIVPKLEVNDAFFVYQDENRENLLAQAVSSQQNAVWATGTHTSTPVLVFIQGPAKVIRPFSKILHHTQLGKMAAQALH